MPYHAVRGVGETGFDVPNVIITLLTWLTDSCWQLLAE
jgi:hypothetical protein